jgi:hypothetical protein
MPHPGSAASAANNSGRMSITGADPSHKTKPSRPPSQVAELFELFEISNLLSL